MKPKQQTLNERTIDLVSVVFASTIILFPIIGNIAGIGKPTNGLKENRQLADFPDLYDSKLSAIPESLDSYFNDNLPYRESIISTANLIRSLWLKLPSDHVIVGEGSWLFYKGDDIFEDLMGKRSLNAQELDDWISSYEAKQQWLSERDIGYVLAVIPNKSTIHTDKLPWWIRANLRKTRLQQIMDHVGNGSGVNVLDLTPDILRLRSNDVQTYWSNDTHWSGYSLKLGLGAIFDACHQFIPDLEPEQLSLWSRIHVNREAGDLAALIGLQESWPRGDRFQLKVTAPRDMTASKTAIANLDRYEKIPRDHHTAPIAIDRSSGNGVAVIFHDSFLKTAEPSPNLVENYPMALPFRRCVMIWSRPTLQDIQAVVEIEKPDVVIEERVERLLYDANTK